MWFLFGLLLRTLTDEAIEKLGLEFITENKSFIRILRTIRTGGRSETNALVQRFISRLTPQEVKEVQGQVNNVLRHTRVKQAILQHAKVQLQSRGLTPNSFLDQQLEKLSKEELQKIDLCDFSLSSSWIASGCFYPRTRTASGSWKGELLITVKTGKHKSYLYPGVPLETWEQMKAAIGANGSGAGWVFWNSYLHGYKGGLGAPKAPKKRVKQAKAFVSKYGKTPTKYISHAKFKRKNLAIKVSSPLPPKKKRKK